MSQFYWELAQAIEEMAVDHGMKFEALIKMATEMIEKRGESMKRECRSCQFIDGTYLLQTASTGYCGMKNKVIKKDGWCRGFAVRANHEE